MRRKRKGGGRKVEGNYGRERDTDTQRKGGKGSVDRLDKEMGRWREQDVLVMSCSQFGMGSGIQDGT